MPKLLPNIRQKLLERGGELLRTQGYSALTIRGLAADCGTAAGTVYNYFKDKDTLIACVMLADWQRSLAAVQAAAQAADGPGPVLRGIHEGLRMFAAQYEALFRDENARRSFSAAGRGYHAQLRASLAKPLQPFFSDPFLPDFLAEALLTWTMEGKSYAELEPVLTRLCNSG